MPNPICEPTSTTAKRQKPANHRRQPPLLPGLTDDVAVQCLSLVHPSFLFSVCRSWRCLVYSPSFPPFLSLYTLLSPRPDHDDYRVPVPSPPTTTTTNSEKWGSDSSQEQDPDPVPSAIHLFCFDPISARWQRLPPPPFRPLIRHPSFLSATFPIQSVATAVRLVIVASTAAKFLPALSRPLVFTPSSRRWSLGPPLDTPRRWCAAGTAGGAVFVASGVGSHYRNDVARSLEKWNPSDDNKRNWEKRKFLKDAKFSREAIDAVGWRGKLCLVNVKGDAAKQGAIYDIAGDEWEEMPEGMVGGWRGPAAAMDEDVIYGIDESRGSLRRYDPVRDAWEEVVAGDNRLRRGAEHIAAGGGRVCVVCCGGEAILVVDVAASPPKVWTVEPPVGFQAVAVHIMPRVKDVDTWL